MSKYDPLGHHLMNLHREEWTASFDQIETVLGFRLPYSARSYPAWWENEQGGNHSHARVWLNAGLVCNYLDQLGE